MQLRVQAITGEVVGEVLDTQTLQVTADKAAEVAEDLKCLVGV
jgi:hypothetical protein